MSRRESDDDYGRIVCRLNGRWRVIECRDGAQWILQYRASAAKAYAGVRWVSRSYCRTREALKSVCACHTEGPDAKAWAVLHGLPRRLS